MNTFATALASADTLLLDGGLATQLESMGFDISGHLWSARLLDSHPRAIIDAHRAYLEAGADCIISASYQASRAGFAAIGKSKSDADDLIARSVRLAKTARCEFLAANSDAHKMRPLVAASVGPHGATQHDGSEYTGKISLTESALADFHRSRLAILDKAGADVLAVETIPNLLEARVLRDLLRDVSTPAWIAFCCSDADRLRDGSSLGKAAALFAQHPTVAAIGINCSTPGIVAAAIDTLQAAAPDKAVVVYPNSGEQYHAQNNSWSGKACDFDNDFNVQAWRAAGATLIGGCCRTGPEDIARMRSML